LVSQLKEKGAKPPVIITFADPLLLPQELVFIPFINPFKGLIVPIEMHFVVPQALASFTFTE